MTGRSTQDRRFRRALARKSERSGAEDQEARKPEAAHRSAQGPLEPPTRAGRQRSLIEHGRRQDVLSPREKSSGKGKKTADKWNQ
jgi:hypothetical protein